MRDQVRVRVNDLVNFMSLFLNTHFPFLDLSLIPPCPLLDLSLLVPRELGPKPTSWYDAAHEVPQYYGDDSPKNILYPPT